MNAALAGNSLRVDVTRGRGFYSWEGHTVPTSPCFYLVSSPGARHLLPCSQEADGSGCHWGHALGFFFGKGTSRALLVSRWSSLRTSLCQAGRAGSMPRKPVPSLLASAPGLLTDVFKNGLLGLVWAGFLCHHLSKFCFNLTWRPAGDPRGSVWLDFWLLYACPLWRVSGARLVFSVVPLQAVSLHFSSLFINQYLILTLFLPSLC